MKLVRSIAAIICLAAACVLSSSPRTAGACTETRVPGPCTLHCINGVSCTGKQFCIFDSCGTGIVCDGRAFNCRI
jgi:hypothetical protein